MKHGTQQERRSSFRRDACVAAQQMSVEPMDDELADGALVLDDGLEDDGLAACNEGDGSGDGGDAILVGDRGADEGGVVELQRVLL